MKTQFWHRPSDELDLLLCCAGVCPSLAQQQRLASLLEKPLDWEAILPLARQHGLVPLVHKHLDKPISGAVPDAVRTALRTQAHAHARRNLLLTGELVQLLELFESHHIPTLPFKGPALAAFLYGDLSLRPFYDLDILVQPSDVPRAEDLLRVRGYVPQQVLTPSQESFHRRWYYERCFLHPRKGISVEIQWNVVPKYFAVGFPEDVWTSLRPLQLTNRTVNTLSHENLLLLLCVHGTKHVWAKLRWIVDVAEVVDKTELDWRRVMGCAQQGGCLRIVLLSLALAQDLLDTVLPDSITKQIEADHTIPGLVRHVRNMLFCSDGPPQLRESMGFHLRTRERRMDRLRYRFRLALTPSIGDFAAIRIPAPLFSLYYAIRPLRLLTKYVRLPST